VGAAQPPISTIMHTPTITKTKTHLGSGLGAVGFGLSHADALRFCSAPTVSYLLLRYLAKLMH
jgi:hypothetical protein